MFELTSHSALDHFAKEFDGLSIKGLSDFEIVSLAIAKKQNTAFSKAFKRHFSTNLPLPGHWSETLTGKVLWTGQDQYFLFNDGIDECLDEKLADSFGDKAYTTLQTDGWANLQVSGAGIHDVFERFIPLDLRNWKTGQGTRCSAHHIALLILKTNQSSYELYTPQSSSASFLEALLDVTEHVLGK